MQGKSSLRFSERLATALNRAGMRASRLALEAGVSKGYVSGLLSGVKDQPSIETCKKFSEVLECSLGWLFEGEQAPTPPPSAPVSATFAPPRFDGSDPLATGELLEVLKRVAVALEGKQKAAEELLPVYQRMATALERLAEDGKDWKDWKDGGVESLCSVSAEMINLE